MMHRQASQPNLSQHLNRNDQPWEWCSEMVLHSYSSKRVAWITLGLVFMSCDIVQLTMEVFDVRLPRVVEVLELLANVYWTFDICVSFCFGCSASRSSNS